MLDYLFYRIYLIHKPKDNAPFVFGVIFVWAYIVSIIIPLVWGINDLFYLNWQNSRSIIYPIYIIILCITIWRYKKKKEDIFKRFEKCSLNKIPDWLFGVLAFFFMLLCASVSIYILKHCIEPFMWEHNLMGCYNEYLPSFMIPE